MDSNWVELVHPWSLTLIPLYDNFELLDLSSFCSHFQVNWGVVVFYDLRLCRSLEVCFAFLKPSRRVVAPGWQVVSVLGSWGYVLFFLLLLHQSQLYSVVFLSLTLGEILKLQAQSVHLSGFFNDTNKHLRSLQLLNGHKLKSRLLVRGSDVELILKDKISSIKSYLFFVFKKIPSLGLAWT